MDRELDAPDRLALVNPSKCKPNKCDQQCRRICPVVRMGKQCIEVTKSSKVALISETLCNGCGMCVKKCPFEAVKIIRLPKSLNADTTHRYGPNGFKLHRLPQPRQGDILGFLGENGCGKTTACKVLAGKLKPNLGKIGDNEAPSWEEIIKYFRGSALQNFFKKNVEGQLKAVTKPQHVHLLSTQFTGTVSQLFDKLECSLFPELSEVEPAVDPVKEKTAPEEVENKLKFIATKKKLTSKLSLDHLMDREVRVLSGGELQRLAIAYCCLQTGDMYIFDEPCAYLDIKQRIVTAKLIRKIPKHNDLLYVVIVEHDISILDLLCDFICIFYGTGNAFGVVTQPFGVAEGVNMYMDGYIKSENVRFRPESIVFAGYETEAEEELKLRNADNYSYSSQSIKLDTFSLLINPGSFSKSQVTVLLGENGTGKTTFIKLIAGFLKTPEGDDFLNGKALAVSYKPQVINVKSDMTVRAAFDKHIGSIWQSPTILSELLKPLNILPLLDQNLPELSGGELQRVSITICLCKAADVYLLDEPSNFLDVEQRVKLAKVIKRFARNNKKVVFVVEHDLNMASYMADQFIIFEGTPGVTCIANSPENWNTGLNHFLKTLDLSMRYDSTSGRPRVNKPGSYRDREQKVSGQYITDTPKYL